MASTVKQTFFYDFYFYFWQTRRLLNPTVPLFPIPVGSPLGDSVGEGVNKEVPFGCVGGPRKNSQGIPSRPLYSSCRTHDKLNRNNEITRSNGWRWTNSDPAEKLVEKNGLSSQSAVFHNGTQDKLIHFVGCIFLFIYIVLFFLFSHSQLKDI